MAYLRRTIDAVNREIQFEVVENCASVNLKFDVAFVQADINKLKVRVEKITKNQPDQTLYSCTVAELKSVLKFAFPEMGNILPFSIGRSLELNDDNKILVTIILEPDEDDPTPLSFEFELNKFVEVVKNPMLIKKVVVYEELTLSTELYQLIMLSKDVESYETIVLKQDTLGRAQPSKIFFGKQMIKSQIQMGADFNAMVTSPNQDVTIKGNSTIYLISL